MTFLWKKRLSDNDSDDTLSYIKNRKEQFWIMLKVDNLSDIENI